MSSSGVNILLVEDSFVITTQLTKLIKAEFPRTSLLAARSVAEAQILASEFRVDMAILDIHLPDGDGVDLLCDLQTINPTLPAIVITAGAPAERKQRALELGVLKFLEKPLDLPLVVNALRGHLIPPASAEEPTQVFFRGALSNLTVLDIIQVKCGSKATAVLEFATPEGVTGMVYLRKGEIIHAEADGVAGIYALGIILSWKKGNIREKSLPRLAPKTIEAAWHSALLSASQVADEIFHLG